MTSELIYHLNLGILMIKTFNNTIQSNLCKWSILLGGFLCLKVNISNLFLYTKKTILHRGLRFNQRMSIEFEFARDIF